MTNPVAHEQSAAIRTYRETGVSRKPEFSKFSTCQSNARGAMRLDLYSVNIIIQKHNGQKLITETYYNE